MDWNSFFSVVLGALISLGTSICMFKIESKKADAREKYKISYEIKKIRFSNFLLKARALYDQSDNFVKCCYDDNWEGVVGSGLKDDLVADLKKLYAKNYPYLDKNLHDVYNKVIHEFEFDESRYNITQTLGEVYSEQGEEFHDFFFDDDRELLTEIDKQIKEIDEMYFK